MAGRAAGDGQEALYRRASATYAAMLARLARATEANAEAARDLEQELHLALWRSLARFDGRCSLGTWVYRVAHNVAATHAFKGARTARAWSLDDAERLVADDDAERTVGDRWTLERLRGLIATLRPADRTVMLLYLEDLDAAAIAEVTGLTPGNVAVKVHRIKALLGRAFAQGEPA